jgi:flap endonuclease-1
MKEHGTLDKVVAHLRAKSELKAAKAQKKAVDEDDVESEDEIPPSSDVDRGGMGSGSEGEADEDETAAEERRKQREMKDQKKKAASRRGTGGVHVPENWMWEEAKKLFEKPDVTPANEIEVSPILSIWAETTDQGVTFLV